MDYGANSSKSYGFGIIRNNLIKTLNYPSYKMVTGINVEKLIIENNAFEGTVTYDAIETWGNTVGSLLVVRNNDINVTYSGSVASLISSNHKMFVFENNKVSVIYSDINNNITDFFHIYNVKVFIRENSIKVSIPSGYQINDFILESLGDSDREPGYVNVENNEILIDGVVDNLANVFLNGLYSTSKPYVVFMRNLINSSGLVNRILRLAISGNIVYVTVRDNQVNNKVANKFGAWASSSTAVAYIDADILFELYANIRYYYIKRNSGVATIPAGSTRVTVSHGLVTTPTKFQITPLGQPPGKLWVENITSTSFDIVTDTAPASNLNVSWYAEV